jgi:hypothetical protein
MKRCLSCGLLLVVIGWPPNVSALPPPQEQPGTGAANPAPDPATFAAELRRLQREVAQGPSAAAVSEIRRNLPVDWKVSADERVYTISSEPLRSLLDSANKDASHREKLLQDSAAWLDQLATQVEGFARPRRTGNAEARARLDKILTRSEFAAVRPPGTLQQLRGRITRWLQEQLLRFFRGLDRYPIVGKIIFWLILLAAVAFLGLWLFRFWNRGARLDALPTKGPAVTHRTWQEWLQAGRRAAEKGDFREAVHAAYWAGIVRLEDVGSLPRERTRTPREYLRLLTDESPGELAPRKAHREPLAYLTACLERVWYAGRPAGPEDFRDSVHQLEALGCPVE